MGTFYIEQNEELYLLIAVNCKSTMWLALEHYSHDAASENILSLMKIQV